MNLIVKSAAKIIEEFSQLNGKNDAKRREDWERFQRRNGKTK